MRREDLSPGAEAALQAAIDQGQDEFFPEGPGFDRFDAMVREAVLRDQKAAS